ncbi:SMI1/KNR4 family protein [Anaerosinus massiliensis]|uniref:SMI1/KNR4 family protein n=2 Tax=Massilibacillus massiliensis TaxID=1806837 RepID=UPI000B04AED7|nr:SMI1/KNR4 family protein [Massilibacillus massiliensis]
MEKKYEFLKKYNRDVKIISLDENNNLDSNILPNEWIKLFKEEKGIGRIEFLLKIWKKHVGKELCNTIAYLNDYLEDVELIKIAERYSILYTIKNSKGHTLYYEGRNPNEEFNNGNLEESWNKLPISIRKFYENVHNGFFYYASESMGLVPLESVTYLNDYEWGILDELKEPLQLDFKTSFGFFSNGMGGYVVSDYQNCNNNNGTLWWKDDQPDYKINFWDVVDEWIVIGFEP